MGALPGGSVLSLRSGRVADWFDVEPFRAAGRRAVVRSVDRPTLVLGSTQDAAIVDTARLRRRGVELVRRRSGGGAVLLSPGGQVWVDIWVPRDDPLWTVEPRQSAGRVGEWWAASLAPAVQAGAAPLSVHAGAASAPVDRRGELVCFAGVGAGEVLAGHRKLVGLAQWRSREGALVHGCAYRTWDAAAIAELVAAYGPPVVPDGRLALPDGPPVVRQGEDDPGADRAADVAALQERAVGLDAVGAGTWTAEHLLAALPDLPVWEIVRT